MNKFIILFLSMGIINCEKPAPQRPKVISSNKYFDTLPEKVAIALDTIQTLDRVDSITTVQDSSMVELPDPNSSTFITYTNVAEQIVYLSYKDDQKPRKVNVKFPEQSLFTTLTETDYKSNVYTKENMIWETSSNRRLGKLTISGTWFEFIRE